MFEGKKAGAVLLMAGNGSRLGDKIPKQFLFLNEKPIYCYALNTLIASNFFDEIILVSHPDWLEIPHPNVVLGGKTRQESSYIGLRSFKKKPEFVLIHDAARPFLTIDLLKENLHKASQFGAVNTCIPCTDTIVHAPNGQVIESIPQRKDYLRGQTPQTFRYDWILEAHEKALKDGCLDASDDCQLILRLGKKIHVAAGHEANIKITSEIDLRLAENICLEKTPFC